MFKIHLLVFKNQKVINAITDNKTYQILFVINYKIYSMLFFGQFKVSWLNAICNVTMKFVYTSIFYKYMFYRVKSNFTSNLKWPMTAPIACENKNGEAWKRILQRSFSRRFLSCWLLVGGRCNFTSWSWGQKGSHQIFRIALYRNFLYHCILLCFKVLSFCG